MAVFSAKVAPSLSSSRAAAAAAAPRAIITEIKSPRAAPKVCAFLPDFDLAIIDFDIRDTLCAFLWKKKG